MQISCQTQKSETLRAIIKGMDSTKIFSVTFRKKNGEMRDMVCRTGVKKGVTGKGMNYCPVSKGLLSVYDMQAKGFRIVNLNTLTRLKIDGKEFHFAC